jgi:hypothetical protein
MALGALLLSTALIDPAFARKPKTRFVAKVNGKRLKAPRRATFFIYTTGSFSIAGATTQRGASRTVTANCLGDLAAVAPHTTLSCYGTYTEVRRRKPAKDWQRNEGMQVTINSFDGTRAVGSFSGTLDPSAAHATDPPATVTNGVFSVVVTTRF